MTVIFLIVPEKLKPAGSLSEIEIARSKLLKLFVILLR